jgi:hypothetical protein
MPCTHSLKVRLSSMRSTRSNLIAPSLERLVVVVHRQLRLSGCWQSFARLTAAALSRWGRSRQQLIDTDAA